MAEDLNLGVNFTWGWEKTDIPKESLERLNAYLSSNPYEKIIFFTSTNDSDDMFNYINASNILPYTFDKIEKSYPWFSETSLEKLRIRPIPYKPNKRETKITRDNQVFYKALESGWRRTLKRQGSKLYQNVYYAHWKCNQIKKIAAQFPGINIHVIDGNWVDLCVIDTECSFVSIELRSFYDAVLDTGYFFTPDQKASIKEFDTLNDYLFEIHSCVQSCRTEDIKTSIEELFQHIKSQNQQKDFYAMELPKLDRKLSEKDKIELTIKMLSHNRLTLKNIVEYMESQPTSNETVHFFLMEHCIDEMENKLKLVKEWLNIEFILETIWTQYHLHARMDDMIRLEMTQSPIIDWIKQSQAVKWDKIVDYYQNMINIFAFQRKSYLDYLIQRDRFTTFYEEVYSASLSAVKESPQPIMLRQLSSSFIVPDPHKLKSDLYGVGTLPSPYSLFSNPPDSSDIVYAINCHGNIMNPVHSCISHPLLIYESFNHIGLTIPSSNIYNPDLRFNTDYCLKTGLLSKIAKYYYTEFPEHELSPDSFHDNRGVYCCTPKPWKENGEFVFKIKTPLLLSELIRFHILPYHKKFFPGKRFKIRCGFCNGSGYSRLMPEVLIWKIKTSLALQARSEPDERISQLKLNESIKWNAIQKQVEEYLRYGTRLSNTIVTEMHALYNECLILLELAIMNYVRNSNMWMNWRVTEVIDVICGMRPIWFYIEDHSNEQTRPMAIQFKMLIDKFRAKVLDMRETTFSIFTLFNSEQNKYYPKTPYVTQYEFQGNMDVPHYSIFTNSLYQWLLEKRIILPNLNIEELDAPEFKNEPIEEKEAPEFKNEPNETKDETLEELDIDRSRTNLYLDLDRIRKNHDLGIERIRKNHESKVIIKDKYEIIKNLDELEKELSSICTLPLWEFINLLKNTDVPSNKTLFSLPMGFNVIIFYKEKERDNANRLKLFMNLFFSSHRRTQTNNIIRQKLIRLLYKIGNEHPNMLPIQFPIDNIQLLLRYVFPLYQFDLKNLPQLIQTMQNPDSIVSLDIMKPYGKRKSRKKSKRGLRKTHRTFSQKTQLLTRLLKH